MSAESRNIGGHRPPLQQESKSIQLLVLLRLARLTVTGNKIGELDEGLHLGSGGAPS